MRDRESTARARKRCSFYEGVLPVLANDAVVMVAASVH